MDPARTHQYGISQPKRHECSLSIHARAAAGVAPSDVRYYKDGMCERSQFEAALTAGVPLCIENAHLRLQGEWNPEAFIAKYGSMIVSPIDSLTGEYAPGEWTVERYFNYLVSGDTTFRILKLKVRGQLFENVSPHG